MLLNTVIFCFLLLLSPTIATDVVHLTGDNFEHEVCLLETTNHAVVVDVILHLSHFVCISLRHKQQLEQLQEIGL